LSFIQNSHRRGYEFIKGEGAKRALSNRLTLLQLTLAPDHGYQLSPFADARRC
jgi:hypothetical protein